MSSALLQTIVADLKAGESYLIKEADAVGLFLWNTVKGVFIALGPMEAQILQDLLSVGVASLGSGKSIEDTFTAILNSAKAEEQTVLLKAGSGIVQTLIAGIKAGL